MEYLNPSYGIWSVVALFILRTLWDIGKTFVKKNQDEQDENTEAIKNLTIQIAGLTTSFENIQARLNQTDYLKTEVAKLEERIDGHNTRIENLES